MYTALRSTVTAIGVHHGPKNLRERQETVMWNPWKRGKQREDALIRAVEALERISTAQSDAFQAQAAAISAQMTAMTRYLDLFKVTEPPESRVMRDEDEWAAEQMRELAGTGFPVGASAKDQLEYVLASMSQD